jgi:hypothetical protein
MSQLTEIDNRVDKVLSKIKEMESAFLEIQQPRTPFVLEKFVVGQHDTLETQYQQCVLELQVKYDNIRRARLNKKKILIKISEYATRNTELDKVEADLLTIDLEEQERAMLGAIREFETLYSIWQSFPKKYTREDIDKNQADYWQKRLSRQAQQDIQATGRVGAGNSEALRQIEMENILKPKIASNVNMINKKEFIKCMVAVHTTKKNDKINWLEDLMVPDNIKIRALNLAHDNYEESINYAIDEAKKDDAEMILIVDQNANPNSLDLKKIIEIYKSIEDKNVVLCGVTKETNLENEKEDLINSNYLHLGFSLFPIPVLNDLKNPILETNEKSKNFKNLYSKLKENSVSVKFVKNIIF